MTELLDPAAVLVDAPEVELVSEPAEPAHTPGLFRRIGQAIIRRPLQWVDRPWTLERVVQTVTAFVFLLVAAIITLNVVHWDLVTTNNTPTGGDIEYADELTLTSALTNRKELA